MKRLSLIAAIVTLFSFSMLAQFATVQFEEELNQFNGGQALPAEKNILITGSISANIQLVEIAIFTGKGKDNRGPLYWNTWRRPDANIGTQYKVPMNYKLNAGKAYDFSIQYFQVLTTAEQAELYQVLLNNLDTYVDQSFEVGKRKLQFGKKTKHIISDLNDVVNSGLSNYRTTNAYTFEGFSDMVRGQLDRIESAKLKRASRIMNTEDKKQAKHSYREQMINDLKKMIRSEVQFVLNNQWNGVYKSHQVDNAETEKRNGYFAVNVGYGAVYLDGKIDNLTYGAGPYVGLSFPLSTSTIAPRFLRNSSVTLGIFINDFEDADGNKITGPIIKKPIYLGLDYRLFQFIRFNAGASFLEKSGIDNGQISGIEKRVFIKPFIGLSAKINLSIGLDK